MDQGLEEEQAPPVDDRMEMMQAVQDPAFLNSMHARFQTIGTIHVGDEVYEANMNACMAERRYKAAISELEVTFFDLAGILRRDDDKPCNICHVELSLGQDHSDYCKSLTRYDHLALVYSRLHGTFDQNVEHAHGYDAVMKILYHLERQDREREALVRFGSAVYTPEAREIYNQELRITAVRHRIEQGQITDLFSDHADIQIARDMQQRDRMLVQFFAYLKKVDRKTKGRKFTDEDQFGKTNRKIRKLLRLRNSFE